MAETSWLTVLARTAALRLCALPVTAVCVFASASMTIHYAGASAFGIVSMIAQLQLALPFADLGLGAAVARAAAQPDRRYAAALILRTAALLAAIGGAGAAVVIMLGMQGTWSALLNVPAGLESQLDTAVTVVLAVFLLSLPLGIAERILLGADRAALLVVLGVIPALGNLCWIAAAGALGLPPIWLVLGLPLGILGFLAACLWFALGSSRTRWCAVWQLRQAAGAQEVPVGSILLGGLPVVAATVLWPRFARGAGRGLWRQGNTVLIGLAAGAGAGYLLLARPAASLISGGAIELGWPVVTLLAAVVPLTLVMTGSLGAAAPAVAMLCAVLAAQVVPGMVLAARRIDSADPAVRVPAVKEESTAS
ncbi:hypothetical protein [Nesterenkonia sp.]|uniref:hypothetical protein n=1 Tax=Nesterenkonia sp. TaxID=704201 RepID=UPI00263039EB|nr:hypothetical protein [Nesterenkonia sp.]